MFDIWHSKKGSDADRSRQVVDEIVGKLPIKGNNAHEVRTCIVYLCKVITSCWKGVYRVKSVMMEKHSNWLSTIEKIVIKKLELNKIKSKVIIVADLWWILRKAVSAHNVEGIDITTICITLLCNYHANFC